MKQFPLYIATLLALHGCVSVPTIPTSTSPTAQSTVDNSKTAEKLPFLDSGAFDTQLSNFMTEGYGTIEITLIRPVLIDAMPERLGRWLTAVADYRGRLDVKPESGLQAQSIFSLEYLIGLLPQIQSYVGETMLYSVAGNYNSTIYYDPASNQVKRILFSLKPAQTQTLNPAATPK